MAEEIYGNILALIIVLGIFFLAYTAYRKQSLIDTVNEIKEVWQDKIEETKDLTIYK